MTTFVLSLRDRLLREYEPEEGMLIGRSRHCDISVQDAQVPSKAYIVESDGDSFQLRDASITRRVIPFSPGDEVEIGEHRLRCIAQGASPCTTQALPRSSEEVAFSLVVGNGKRARYLPLTSQALRIGSNLDCDVRLNDRTVSAEHCELEATGDGILIRDLGSRNGTWVNGQRVLSALESNVGFTARVGCTRLHVVPRGKREDADRFVVRSEAMTEVMDDVRRFAALPYPALVLGESGVGKEGVARALHDLGPRASGPFVAINAATLGTLIESELFGHEKGAFTGANVRREGAFMRAKGGTLFLDEIGELPLVLQTRLLRVLETWTVRPLGADRELPVDVRVVAATHQEPTLMVQKGTLRRDLFHRLARLVIRVPSLQTRKEDIRPLAELFLEQFAEVGGMRRFSRDALSFLESCDFPGNVRELRNLVQSAAALSDGPVDREALERSRERFGCIVEHSDEQLLTVLHRYDGNASAAARSLGMARTTFRDRLRRVQPAKDAA